jgi:hypothetical protein
VSKPRRFRLQDNLPRKVQLPLDGTVGAIVGVNLTLQDGSLVTEEMLFPGEEEEEFPFTYWRLLREIPQNIRELAALDGTGYPWRNADGTWRLRKVGRVVAAFSFGDASPRPIYECPHDLHVVSVRIAVRVALNGAAPQLMVGHGGAPDSLFPADHVAPGVVGTYEYTPELDLSAGTGIDLAIDPDSSSAGSGLIAIDTIPLNEEI